MFLHQLNRIEAEAFLTLASELIEEDGVLAAEEDALLEEYKRELNLPTFTYDPAASAMSRDTLAQLNDVGKRKVYLELYRFAVCDGFEDAAERRALNALRDALGLDDHVCRMLEQCVNDLNGIYAEIERALNAEPSPVVVDYDT